MNTTPGSQGAHRGNPTITAILALAMISVLILSVYAAVEVPALQNQISSIQGQNSFLQGEVSNLQNQVDNLNSRLSTSTQVSTTKIDVTACLSVTPECYTFSNRYVGYVYFIGLTDSGTSSVQKGYSIYLSFKDSTEATFFGFNTTLPSSLNPGGTVYLSATAWPTGTNATSKLAPGDEVGLAVLVGGYQTAISTIVLSCSTSTTTFLNATRTQTATLTRCG